MKKSEAAFNKNFEATKQFIKQNLQDNDLRNKQFDKDFEKQKKEMDQFQRKNFPS